MMIEKGRSLVLARAEVEEDFGWNRNAERRSDAVSSENAGRNVVDPLDKRVTTKQEMAGNVGKCREIGEGT
jgi:hypothetical protein